MNSGGVGIPPPPPPPPPPPFLCKTYDMVDDPATDQVVSWSKTSNSFVVWNVAEFSRDLLPLYFKHNNFSSFVRQLNTYGFRKVDPDRWEFANEGFLRGHKYLLNTIYRRKQPSGAVHNSPAKSCVEVGKFGIEEEVGRLKRDKNVLMQEIFRLRQHQQSTDHHLESVGQRVHVMEQRLQQMMSFLANAMQSSDFVAQLVHHQSESNRQISSGSKKRRLPEQDKEIKQSVVQIDGQMIKYQPIMNEAAKAMLRKILKMNTSESKLINPNSFLIDNVHTSSDVLDSGSLSSRKSGVTLAEVLPTMSSLTDIQSSSALALGKAHDTLFSAGNIGLPAFAGNNINLTNELVNGAGAQEMVRVDAIPGFVQNPIPFMSNEFSADEDGDVLPDDEDKLPGINDVFWEQFLSNSPLTGDTDDVNTGDLGDVIGNDQLMVQEGQWDKLKHLNNLTEQMGLLASASNVG